tara:strand:- start:2390 stop:4912 length:2523 start_codon:yes stop_codon:yes gene_type:complete
MNQVQKLERKMEQLEKDLAKVATTGPKAANGIKKTGRAAATASGNVQRLGIAFRTTLAPIVAITGSLALLNKALNVTGQRSAEASVLSSSLKGLVDDGDAAADALLGIADRLGKATLFDEEDFTAQFKLFTSFRNIGVDSYERVGEAAADIATKLGTGPKEAALQLAKALEDPAKQVTALARSGTVFTEQQKEQIKTLQESGKLLEAQDIILKEIETQYGGAAKAAGSAGFAGALDSAGEAYRDFLEALGSSSESGAVDFLNAITEGLNFLARNFDVVAQAASAVVDVFVQPFVALGQGIAEVLPKVDNFEQFFRGTLAIVAKILTDITTNVLAPVFKFVGKVIGGIVKLLVGLGSAVGSVIPKIVSTVTGAIRILGKAISMFINSLPIGILGKLFGIDAGALATAPLQALANGIDGLADSVSNYGDELKAAADAANLPQPGDAVGGNPFAGARPRGASAGAASGSSSAEKLAKEAQKRAEEMAKGLKSAQGMLRAAENEQRVLQATNDLEKVRVQGAIDLENIAVKYADAAEKAKSAAEIDVLVKAQGLEILNQQLKVEEQLNDLRDSAIKPLEEQERFLKDALRFGEDEARIRAAIREATAGLPEADARRVEELIRGNEALKEQLKLMNDMKALAGELSSVIADGLVDGLKGVVQGTQTAEEAMSKMINSIADLFLQRAAEMIAKAIEAQAFKLIIGLLGGALGGAAGGGGGAAGGVGTTGGVAGFAGASFAGGGYTGDAPRSGGIDGQGGALAILHPQETVIDNYQSRGAMDHYRGESGGGTFRLETTVINGVEYATVDQVRAMGSQAAKQGAASGNAMTMSQLRNSRTQRSKLGMR